MVKIPSLDDLKKAGSGLLNQAKAGNYSGMVDSIKSGIDSVTVNAPKDATDVGDGSVQSRLKALQKKLSELNDAQMRQAVEMQKLQAEITELSAKVENEKTTPPPKAGV
jgi:predicted  nucleic acid-binding Zn-ribbon protein